MIIETDFPDHWKTQRLISICGDKAVMCLLRLWLHCQLRKTWHFSVHTVRKIEAICRWDGVNGMFVNTLIDVGFLDCDNETLIVHDFEQFNSKLCRNWKNGQKGGRPKKSENQNPKETQPKPNSQNGYDWDNQNQTQEEPNQNPTETESEPNQNPKPKSDITGYTQPKPDSKDSKDSKKGKNITPIIPLKGDCVDFFSETLKASGVVDEFGLRTLVDEFATYAQYRKEVCKKAIKAKTGTRHARRVITRIQDDKLTPQQVVQLFETARDNDWQGWDFDSEVQRVKSIANANTKNKKTPPEDISQSMGSFGVPAGAFEGGAL